MWRILRGDEHCESAERCDHVRANDTCIQCHSQGQPLSGIRIGGKYYDWPVGFTSRGKRLADYWRLEELKPGVTNFLPVCGYDGAQEPHAGE